MVITCTRRFASVYVTSFCGGGGRRADIPMPVRESEAIVLRSFPLGEGDRLISFLSRADGRMRGVASGARKPKSRFGSTLELFSYVRIWFYERETRDLVRINQCELIESFFTAQRDYDSELALALASEVTEAVLGEREIAEPNFRLLLVIARAIKAGADPAMALAYFALWTVRLGGWLPQLNRCARCGSVLVGDAFSSQGHGIICENCRVPGQVRISSKTLDVARRFLVTKLENLIDGAQSSENRSETTPVTAVTELRTLMFDMIEERIEKRLRTRRLLEESAGFAI
jgi:DNA repair protein RecO (recombination protein O)